jgi:hypothetical protein
LDDVCKDEFLTGVKANPLGYAAKTVKKLLYGTFLVYGNGGDASYSTSFSKFKSEHPQSGFLDYAKNRPVRILGMILGTLSASILFPLSLVGVFLLFRAKKAALALFFLQIPLYYILLHMFFHYEARYLVGTLPGYLPLVGYVFARATERWSGRNSSKSRLSA